MKKYKDFLNSSNQVSNFYKLSFVKILIEKNIDLKEFDSLSFYLFKNKFFLNNYLDKKISSQEVNIFKNEFILNSHINIYRSYFKNVVESKTEDKSGKTIEFTAYGKSDSQDREIIAFRGIFKNDLLQSYDTRVDACEYDSYIKDDNLSAEYTYDDLQFIEDMIKSKESDLLNKNQINKIFSNWVQGYLDVLNYLKSFFEDTYIEKYIIDNDDTKGVVIKDTEYYKENSYIDAITSFSENQTNREKLGFLSRDKYYLSEFVRNTMSSSSYSNSDIKGLKKITFNIEGRVGSIKTKHESKGYYINEVVDLLIKDFKRSLLFSKNIEKEDNHICSLIDFEMEKEVIKHANKLKNKSNQLAKKIKEDISKVNKQERKNTAIGCFVSIVIIIIIVWFYRFITY